MIESGPPRFGSDPLQDWRHAFNLIWRPDLEMAHTAPTAVGAVT